MIVLVIIVLIFVMGEKNVNKQLPQMWYGSTPLASDIAEMYTSPEKWTQTRENLHAVKFYSQQLRTDCPPSACGITNFTRLREVGAFDFLKSHNLKIATETGGLKDWDCNGGKCKDYLLKVFHNMDTVGSRITYVDLDEPYFAGVHFCGLKDVNDIASRLVNNFIKPLRGNVSYSFSLGDIEPYPALSADEIINWLDTLRKVGGENIIDHFHIDVDFHAVGKKLKEARSDLLRFRDYCDAHQMTFSVIINPAGFGTNTDHDYYEKTMKNVKWWIDNLGKPSPGFPSSRVIFQSWETNVPHNLPESGPYSGTKIVLDSIGMF